jgi:hypothetical protein
MNSKQILGVAVLIAGVALVGFAWHASSGSLERLPDAQQSGMVIGQYSNNTMWYLLLGTAAVVGGTLLALFGKRQSPRGSTR